MSNSKVPAETFVTVFEPVFNAPASVRVPLFPRRTVSRGALRGVQEQMVFVVSRTSTTSVKWLVEKSDPRHHEMVRLVYLSQPGSR